MARRLRIGLMRPDRPGHQRFMEFVLRSAPIADRFARLVDTANVPGHDFVTSWSMGAQAPDLEADVDSLNGHIDAFNSTNRGSARIDQRVSTATVTRRQLNDIHEQFEGHQKAHDAGDAALVAGDSAVIESLHAVNLAVHRLEASLSQTADPSLVYSYFSASIRPSDQSLVEPLEAADYREFTMEEHFGILYANYATTGKNLQHVFWTEDYALLETGGASPQRVLSSGVLAQFNSYRKDHDTEWARFAQWFEEHDIARFGYRLDDERNSIGMIKLGGLVPSRDTRQHYSRLRRRWNARAFVDDFAPYSTVTSMTIEG